MLLSFFDCTKLSAQNGKLALQTSGGTPTNRIPIGGSDGSTNKLNRESQFLACPTEAQTNYTAKVSSGNMSDGSTHKLNGENQFLATCPTEAQTN